MIAISLNAKSSQRNNQEIEQGTSRKMRMISSRLLFCILATAQGSSKSSAKLEPVTSLIHRKCGVQNQRLSKEIVVN